jgi:hypothetical protein
VPLLCTTIIHKGMTMIQCTIRIIALCALFTTAVVHADPPEFGVWDGEDHPETYNEAGDVWFYCGYIYKGKRFWRNKSRAQLAQHNGKCPATMEVTDFDRGILKNALPYKPPKAKQ